MPGGVMYPPDSDHLKEGQRKRPRTKDKGSPPRPRGERRKQVSCRGCGYTGNQARRDQPLDP